MTIPLFMRHNLSDISSYDLPEGYYFRMFKQSDDNKRWAKIVTAINEFPSEKEALERFELEYIPYRDQLEKRVIFIETTDGQTIGTATAWFDICNETEIGRLHWVGIIPEHQGRKLGRPLITRAMQILRKYHFSAYLKTQQSSFVAIQLYKSLDWSPVMKTSQEQIVWDELI